MTSRVNDLKNAPRRKKTQARRTKDEIGPRIVAAWFSTVVNPLLLALRQEQSLLEKENWTWVFRPGDLEFVKRVEEYVPDGAVDNLEQFLGFNEQLRGTIAEHDEWVAKLKVHCMMLQKKIVESPELLRLYRKATSPKALSEMGATLGELFGAYPKQDHLYLLAQYIINHTEFLPDYYYTAKLWNQHRAEFLAILAHPSVAETEGLATFAGEQLLRRTTRLVEQLKTTRENLSLRYDVPYVAPAVTFIQDSY